MTALCGGGSSSPKTFLENVVYLTSAAIASRLNNLGGPWATVVAPLIGLMTLNLSDFCDSDPPTDPTLTAAEYEAILKLDFGAVLTSAIGKLRDKVLYAAWIEFCECNTPPQPVLPTTVFQPPAGTYTPPNQGAATCGSGNYLFVPPAGGTTPTIPEAEMIQRNLFPGQPTRTIPAAPPTWDAHQAVLMTGWVSATMHIETRDFDPDVSAGWEMFFVPHDTAGNDLTLSHTGMIFTGGGNGTDITFALVIPAASVSFTCWVKRTSGPANGSLFVSITPVCSSLPPGSFENPCPPDPAVYALLERLLALVTLIQRQHVPFAQVPGADHTGLTGTGEIAVQGLLGVVVEVTAFPIYLGSQEGNPDRIFDLGYVSKGTPEGWCCTQRVTGEDFFYRLDGDITRVGYSLSPGVTITIHERVREP